MNATQFRWPRRCVKNIKYHRWRSVSVFTCNEIICRLTSLTVIFIVIIGKWSYNWSSFSRESICYTRNTERDFIGVFLWWSFSTSTNVHEICAFKVFSYICMKYECNHWQHWVVILGISEQFCVSYNWGSFFMCNVFRRLRTCF